MSWLLGDSRVVGGMRAAQLQAPFARPRAVLSSTSHPGEYLIASSYGEDGSVSGERVTARDWQELLDSEEALALRQPAPTGSRPRLWLLRSNFPRRERALRQLHREPGAQLHDELHDQVHVVVVDEARARQLLARWSKRAYIHAKKLASHDNWTRTLPHADLAWLTDLSADLDRVALYALALEHTGAPAEASGVLAFEANSRADLTKEELAERIEKFREGLKLTARELISKPRVEGLGRERVPSTAGAPSTKTTRRFESCTLCSHRTVTRLSLTSVLGLMPLREPQDLPRFWREHLISARALGRLFPDWRHRPCAGMEEAGLYDGDRLTHRGAVMADLCEVWEALRADAPRGG